MDLMIPLPNNPHLHAGNGDSEMIARLRGLDCFHYDAYAWEPLCSGIRLTTQYRIGNKKSVQTRSTFHFPECLSTELLDPQDAAGFAIGMVEGISYWKAACPGRWEVHCGSMDEQELAWWSRLLWHGLGEFRYCNSLHATTQGMLCELVPTNRHPAEAHLVREGSPERILVPVGGGKDSLLTLQLLMRWGYEVVPFAINPGRATLRMLDALALLSRLVRVERKIDAKLIAMNEDGYFNGHTPFSAVIGFYAHVAAQALGCGGIALSNEASADEPSVEDVNHQYSKTTSFEKDFRQYQKTWLRSENATYFSLLRPLNEVQIAGLLAQEQADPRLAVSCNRLIAEGVWCGNCSKCLASALLLLPFLGKEWLETSFEGNPLGDNGRWETLLGLLGVNAEKPFDCVPSRMDIRVALSIIHAHHPGWVPRYALISQWQQSGAPGLETWKGVRAHCLSWHHAHFLPEELETRLREEITSWFEVYSGALRSCI